MSVMHVCVCVWEGLLCIFAPHCCIPSMGYNHWIHGVIQLHPCLSVCLPLPATQESGGEAPEPELASHWISLHLLHFLSVLVLYPSPHLPVLSYPPSFTMIYYYPLVIITVLGVADGHNNSQSILPADFKRWFPLKNTGLSGLCHHV